ncbi:MAG: type II toxin-antitoxin system RelE family toxin [Anaerolineae bacterium]
MKVIFKNSFLKDLRRIKERALAMRVKEVIESIEQAPTLQEVTNLKQLKGSTGYYRIRVGDYRIGLRLDGETITLVRFLHRKEVYRYFP